MISMNKMFFNHTNIFTTTYKLPNKPKNTPFIALEIANQPASTMNMPSKITTINNNINNMIITLFLS